MKNLKNRAFTLALALTMCLALVPMTALAANDAPVISDLAIYYGDEGKTNCGLEFTLTQLIENADYLQGQYAVDGGEWKDIDIMYLRAGKNQTYLVTDISAEKSIKFRICFARWDHWTSAWSNVLTLNEKIDLITSDWATAEIKKADELGLIPDSLKGADLTKPITRAEFAAVAVKVYESLGKTTALPAVNNPFTDTKDVEILKAYNVGLTAGTAADKFSPDVLLNREQCATMLTRVFKRVTMNGWTLATDSQFKSLFPVYYFQRFSNS